MTGMVGTLLSIAAAIALICVCVVMLCAAVALVVFVVDTFKDYIKDRRRDRKWKP